MPDKTAVGLADSEDEEDDKTPSHEAPLPFEQTQKEYEKSPKGKEVKKRYRQSKKGKEATKRYQKTGQFKQRLRNYYYSEKGQAAYEKRKRQRDLVKAAESWLVANPGCTIDDYLKHLKEQSSDEKKAPDS